MGSYYSGDHIVGDHIHTDLTTRNIDESPQKYRIGIVSRLLGGLNMLHWIQTLAFCFGNGPKHLVRMKVSSRERVVHLVYPACLSWTFSKFYCLPIYFFFPIYESKQETNKSRIRPMMNREKDPTETTICDICKFLGLGLTNFH